jgi:phytoene dehydrogenase-like protein
VAPKIAKDLGLGAHGFALEWPKASVVSLGGEASSSPLVLWTDAARSREEIARRSPADAAKWMPFASRMETLAGFLEKLYSEEPPRITSGEAADLFGLMAVGLRLRRLGKVDMLELLRTLPMSIQDLLDDSFESDALKTAIGAGGVTNILQGPRSAGTCFVLLHHLVGRPAGAFRARPVVRGGSGDLVETLALAAKALGVEITCGTGRGLSITMREGRAAGVRLPSGEEHRARFVVSGRDPRSTFFELLDPTELEPQLVRAVKNVKLRGARAVVHLALDRRPSFTGVPDEALDGVLSFAPSLDYVERAYDDAKHGRISDRLFWEATLPSVTDRTLAPEGKHVMAVGVQYAPYRLGETRWDAALESSLADRVVAMLDEVAPGLRESVVGRAVYGPTTLEERFGLAEGHLYGGELTLDQILFMRPIPGFAHYKTPIPGSTCAATLAIPAVGCPASPARAPPAPSPRTSDP